MQRIYSIESVKIHIKKSNPSKLGISSVGTVSSSGWTNPHLSPRVYVVPPSDGIQDFDFNAQEPQGIVLPVMLPISAAQLTDKDPANFWGKGVPLVGVRVHSQTNTVEEKIATAADLNPHAFSADFSLQGIAESNAWLLEDKRANEFGFFPDLKCLVCKANPIYWQTALGVKLAKQAGLIKSKEECKDIAGNSEKLAAVLAQVLPGQAGLIAAIVSFAVGACKDCLCDDVF